MKMPRVAHAWSAVLVIAGTLALSACGPVTPGETSAPPTSSTPSATPTETPTPTPTVEAEAEDPAQIGTWIIDGVGIGPIDFDGDPATLPTFLPGIADDACDVQIYQRADGLSFTIPIGPERDRVHAIKMDGGPAALADSPHTAAGIALGSTSAQIEAAYPGIVFADDGVRTPHYVWTTDGRFVHILMEGDAVSGFFVSAFEQLAMDLC